MTDTNEPTPTEQRKCVATRNVFGHPLTEGFACTIAGILMHEEPGESCKNHPTICGHHDPVYLPEEVTPAPTERIEVYAKNLHHTLPVPPVPEPQLPTGESSIDLDPSIHSAVNEEFHSLLMDSPAPEQPRVCDLYQTDPAHKRNVDSGQSGCKQIHTAPEQPASDWVRCGCAVCPHGCMKEAKYHVDDTEMGIDWLVCAACTEHCAPVDEPEPAASEPLGPDATADDYRAVERDDAMQELGEAISAMEQYMSAVFSTTARGYVTDVRAAFDRLQGSRSAPEPDKHQHYAIISGTTGEQFGCTRGEDNVAHERKQNSKGTIFRVMAIEDCTNCAPEPEPSAPVACCDNHDHTRKCGTMGRYCCLGCPAMARQGGRIAVGRDGTQPPAPVAEGACEHAHNSCGTHCCKPHGCKYGYMDCCPVATGKEEPESLLQCEECWEDAHRPPDPRDAEIATLKAEKERAACCPNHAAVPKCGAKERYCCTDCPMLLLAEIYTLTNALAARDLTLRSIAGVAEEMRACVEHPLLRYGLQHGDSMRNFADRILALTRERPA